MEDFKSAIKSLAQKVKTHKKNIETEEATKTSFIMPFFNVLGYNVFDHTEFLPEYTADVGIKKGEKVDYAIMENDEPVVLIEAKSINEKLQKHDSQLFRYFGTTKAKLAILTNGEEYYFYTDIDNLNVMDSEPFFTLNLSNLKDNQINKLHEFRKHEFELSKILGTASELKYLTQLKTYYAQQYDHPSKDFIELSVSQIHSGRKTQAVLDRYEEVVKKAFKEFVNELVSERIQTAIKQESDSEEPTATTDSSELEKSGIVTTIEELEGFAIIKSLLHEHVDPTRITYHDYLNHFNVLLDDKKLKWICRFNLDMKKKWIEFNDDEKTKVYISGINDFYTHKDRLFQILKSLF